MLRATALEAACHVDDVGAVGSVDPSGDHAVRTLGPPRAPRPCAPGSRRPPGVRSADAVVAADVVGRGDDGAVGVDDLHQVLVAPAHREPRGEVPVADRRRDVLAIAAAPSSRGSRSAPSRWACTSQMAPTTSAAPTTSTAAAVMRTRTVARRPTASAALGVEAVARAADRSRSAACRTARRACGAGGGCTPRRCSDHPRTRSPTRCRGSRPSTPPLRTGAAGTRAPRTRAW